MMKPNKSILMILMFSAAILYHVDVDAKGELVIEYDVYEMAESGRLIKFPKKAKSYHVEPSDKGRDGPSAKSTKKDLEVEYDVYEMAESGRLIKFPKKSKSYNHEPSNIGKNAPTISRMDKSPKVEYDVYEMAESGRLIKFPKNHDDLPRLKKALSKIWALMRNMITSPLKSPEVEN